MKRDWYLETIGWCPWNNNKKLGPLFGSLVHTMDVCTGVFNSETSTSAVACYFREYRRRTVFKVNHPATAVHRVRNDQQALIGKPNKLSEHIMRSTAQMRKNKQNKNNEKTNSTQIKFQSILCGATPRQLLKL